jgi:hypothetical protein
VTLSLMTVSTMVLITTLSLNDSQDNKINYDIQLNYSQHYGLNYHTVEWQSV